MKRDQGITLISLVVTIIILIILAGVSINLILGQNGIINKAKEAKENMELATIEEQKQLNEIYNQMGTQINSSPSLGNSGDESKINDFKIAIADYIAEAGGIKPEYTADTLTFGESIKGIVKEATKDATATAEDILEGTTAYVNGELVTGTVIPSKTTEVVYLGSGTSFNVSSYDGYENFTSSNFIVQMNNLNGWNNEYDSDITSSGTYFFSKVTIALNKSYNPTTGVLSAYYGISNYYGTHMASPPSTTASGTIAVSAWLILN